MEPSPLGNQGELNPNRQIEDVGLFTMISLRETGDREPPLMFSFFGLGVCDAG